MAGYTDSDGVQLWYEDRGPEDGPVVLLVSGGGASVVWWPAELLSGLVAAGCRVVQFDNRDTGLSTHVDPGAAPYRLDDMVDDALAVLAASGVDGPAHWLGVSMGGMVCQAAALAHPDRVVSLTLVSTTPGPDSRLTAGDPSVFDGLDRPIETDEDFIALQLDFCRAVAGSRFPFAEEHYREITAADAARGTNRAPGAPSASSRLDDLGRIRAPTLVVHGTEDPVYPFAHAEALAAGIPDATLVPWEGVGHEQPPELIPELVDLVTQHVRTTAGRPRPA
jgi:pimeloyl-ACP methyl ester carboxylesterase